MRKADANRVTRAADNENYMLIFNEKVTQRKLYVNF